MYVHNYDQKLYKKLFGRFQILMLYTFKNSACMYNIKNYMRRSMLPLKSLPIIATAILTPSTAIATL